MPAKYLRSSSSFSILLFSLYISVSISDGLFPNRSISLYFTFSTNFYLGKVSLIFVLVISSAFFGVYSLSKEKY